MRIAVLIFFQAACFAVTAHASPHLRLGLGVSALEESDDRMRPALNLHAQFGSQFLVRAFAFGRTFGPVTETAVAVSASRRTPLFFPNLLGAFGLCLLSETTAIEVPATATNEAVSSSDTRANVGGNIALYWETQPTNRILLSLGWESHLYLAGAAGLFFATGRKQFISATFGLTL